FFGKLGTLRVEHLGELFIAKRGESDWTAIETDLGTLLPGLPDTGFARGFPPFAIAVIEAIRNGRTEIEHAATFNDGVKVQKVLDAARRSDREDRCVSIL
ncbi:MAG: hypothetical protein KA831_05340, partial [Pyrinomonadaceae bacterium]|nr:hypothetical protein [Pyrinomonadaceae bacterium]